jgi:predicted metal-binding membrane protein
MQNITKSYLFTAGLSLIAVVITLFVQLTGQSSVSGCSYLDPIAIDILALLGGFFLIAEGIFKIAKYKKESLKHQLTRSIRVALGCAIVCIHILQLLHK